MGISNKSMICFVFAPPGLQSGKEVDMIRAVFCIWFLLLPVVVSGCAEADLPGLSQPPVENDKVNEEELVTEKEREFVSVDGRVTITVGRILFDNEIPDAVHIFLSGEEDPEETAADAENDTGTYFVDTRLQLYEEEMLYAALFLIIKDIEKGFIDDPRGFGDVAPQLITDEGSVQERTILQFKYTGEPVDAKELVGAPANTEGVMVFAYPEGETPSEVRYFYSFLEEEDADAEKGLIIIPVDPQVER